MFSYHLFPGRRKRDHFVHTKSLVIYYVLWGNKTARKCLLFPNSNHSGTWTNETSRGQETSLTPFKPRLVDN